ncbi:MAG: ubiquitin-like small modifier protein 1 [Natrialbaceae archaeon]
MEIEMRFFANFRDEVGQKTIAREHPDGATVGEVLGAITEEFPGVDLFDEEGDLREFLSVMKNGREVAYLDGLETDLEDGDTISVFPPVAGG